MRDRPATADEKSIALGVRRAIEGACGLEIAARETGLSTTQLSRLQAVDLPDTVGCAPAVTLDRLSGGELPILRALARLHSAVVVVIPAAPADPTGLQAGVMRLTCELGDVAREIGAALADGTVTPREARRVLEQQDELDAASQALRALLLAVLRQAGEGA